MVRNGFLISFVVFTAFATAGGQAIDPALLGKAKAGDASAQIAVGEQYAKAAGAAQDPDDAADSWKQSADWYRKAAEQGSAAGEIHLAECYRDGRGLSRDMKPAAE